MFLILDESGKTGTQKYDFSWNFSKQPYFLLCGILIPEKNVEAIENKINELHKRYKIQGEFKSTKETVKKNINELTEEFWNIIYRNECKILIEVVNKKFCIAMQIVNCCIFPYYDFNEEQYYSYDSGVVRRSFANYIYDKISDNLFGDFVEMFDSDKKDLDKLKSLCCRLIDEADNTHIKEYVEETLDSINNYSERGLLLRHLFPLVDYYKSGNSAVAVCPHIDSFNNILSKTESISLSNVIHDKMNELSEALQQAAIQQNREIEFGDSKKNALLQLADFWAGTIREAVEKVLLNGETENKIINDIIQYDLNFVSSFSEQLKLFPNNYEVLNWKEWYEDAFKK
ncbi:hypothetical protein Cpap_0172 [Ruminiclostridium papyrosolvens DSM 2782]|uniref:DUF3800 domain-containing protein n=1 Tax=Ruminiclostridium papyrosolvens DSM 2782 TaxID=588581 RepID=F1TII8_9FIRM|nr:DUF3800 domain-containing protein [Ruminiclostridium papyrosolvens]EGD45805.1 hypothetical protein Cpap_0172 [Ruminiclostridium papyrosolvens DSM 2782]WES33876.1 DUF3800 domain-containing protein [Ruminiclostridium papyrosolvens DSM 2782]